MVTDAILFHCLYLNAPYIRFGRLFRPIKVVLLSRDLFKTIRAILKIIPQLLDVIVLMTVLTLVYAFVGQ